MGVVMAKQCRQGIELAAMGEVGTDMARPLEPELLAQLAGKALSGLASLAGRQGATCAAHVAADVLALVVALSHGRGRRKRNVFPDRAAAGVALEPCGSRWRRQAGRQAFRRSGHAHGTAMFAPKG